MIATADKFTAAVAHVVLSHGGGEESLLASERQRCMPTRDSSLRSRMTVAALGASFRPRHQLLT